MSARKSSSFSNPNPSGLRLIGDCRLAKRPPVAVRPYTVQGQNSLILNGKSTIANRQLWGGDEQ
jgi:hypothetical protein